MTLSLIALIILGAVGYLVWSKLWRPSAQTTTSSIEQCEQNYRKDHPEGRSIAESDMSQCDPGIVSYTSLSDTEKINGKRNSQLEAQAIKDRDVSKCDRIKGNLYIGYPPNLTKDIVLKEADAKAHCRNLVQAYVRQDRYKASSVNSAP